ncbi:hypothetical protein [Leptolyngbya sp. 7M]|uniref:hypothetical protein n=1 Tax=Leptolyngbya sp. 7M TaxID=2812896 RepID=UPI001B8D558C|nr:hypothetical protein [Leptolyngbya sp. 7M]QYO66328.1 hypothetical protein JVX88_05880 [Leptolyngbya sp. 7M]
MKRHTKYFVLGLVIAASAFTIACPKRVSIAEIEANPSRYQNKDIAIAGTVQDSFGVNIPGTPIRGGAYKISDGTGSIWVLTENTVPGKGTQLGVKGRVGSGVNWKGRNYGLGMFEKDRRFAKR